MSERKRILIVGGVAGGASAAARARRLSEDAEIVIFERGEHISFANCGLPYHIGEVIPDRQSLLIQTPESMARRFRVDVRTRCEVVSIDPKARSVVVRDLDSGTETIEGYDKLILSPGAAPVAPPISGVELPGVHSLRSVGDMDATKRIVDEDSPGRAVVVGGGYIGLEMAEALRMRDLEVTLVELADQVFIAADGEMVAPIHQQLELHGVDLRLGVSVSAIETAAEKLKVVLSTDESIECGLVIMAVGVRPEAALGREAGLEIGPTGGIAVDEHMRTSDPDIFAVGDAVEVTEFVGGYKALIPLAGPANRQGRIAADNIFGRPSIYRDTQGTAICKVFDLAIGMTGMSEKLLIRAAMDYEKIYIHPVSHAGYYPGAAAMSIKLLFNPGDGRILGAQAVGGDGVDKRIDVLAVSIRAGLTVSELQDLELSYAPPYGSARDPVNYAGFVASNVLAGDMQLCHTPDMIDPGENQILLDVRTSGEVDAGTIGGAVNIPLDDLRDRLDELPADKELLVFCAAGLRGYLACRILSQNGYACRNLTGGYKTFKAVTERGIGEKKNGEPASAVSAPAAAKPAGDVEIVTRIDACGLQCPGPIMQVARAVENIVRGQGVSIVTGDSGFAGDIAGWCDSTGNTLLEVVAEKGSYRATIVKGAPQSSSEPACGGGGKSKTLVMFSGDFDKAMAGFIIANGAVAMGSEVTMFFTFWGLNILRRDAKVRVRKSLIERMFGWMMPRGARRLKLSKMNMGGMGTAMIKGIMNRKNVSSLPDLIDMARDAGVRLVACSMSMDLMGIKREELIDGVEEGGVAMYLNSAESGNVNLFI
jgi:NADPH-dependent 2,4-dienoyl-CoA reductase/sulfur reductase-like enzyme/peroxiredoxin family protein/rhodanese-related sulfurtransferase/TusA-related sulfurtransferase